MDGKTCEEIKVKLDAIYGDLSPSMTTVRYWFNEFKRGRISVFDKERLDCSADVVTAEIFKKVQDMILVDRRKRVREVAEAVGMSYGTVINILHDKLRMRKLSARWMSLSLTMDNKRIRLATSKKRLDLFERNPQGFLGQVVTADENLDPLLYARLSDKQNDVFFQENLLRRRYRRSYRPEMAMIF